MYILGFVGPRWWAGTWWAEKIRNNFETRFWCLGTSRCSSRHKDAETLSPAKWHLEVKCCLLTLLMAKGHALSPPST